MNWANRHYVGLVSTILGLYLILSSTIVFAERPDVENFVTELYRKCLGRDPDSEGLNYHTNLLMSREAYGADIAGHLIFSSELVNKTVTNADFVKTLYECLHGIETEEKYGYYISRLDDGASRREIFHEFVNTPAFKDYCDSHGVTAFSPVPSIFSDRFFVILCIVTLILVSSIIYLFSKMDEQELSRTQPK